MIIFGWNTRQWDRVLGWYEKLHGEVDWSDIDVLARVRKAWLLAGGPLAPSLKMVGF